MKSQTIRALNQVNTDFYQQVASSFSDTRQQAWPGWDKLMAQVKPTLPVPTRILDVGCGNGRFLTFLTTRLLQVQYIGIDNNDQLLQIAQQLATPAQFSTEWHQRDLVESLLTAETLLQHPALSFDLTVSFGVMHHIPSFKLRLQLLLNLLNQTKQGGFVCFTLWRFLDTERLAKKRVSFSEVNISTDDLETNDFLLTWQRGTTAYRYCHYINDIELNQLLANLPAKKVTTFFDDAKEGNVNLYVILQKN